MLKRTLTLPQGQNLQRRLAKHAEYFHFPKANTFDRQIRVNYKESLAASLFGELRLLRVST